MSKWEDRYKLAVAKFAGAPDGIDPKDVEIMVSGEDGYHYSSYTFADPSIDVVVYWPGGMKRIDGPEAVAELIRSFSSP